MEINKNAAGDKLTLEIVGRLDAASAPQLEKELNASLTGVKSLIFDFSKLEYIASAGLRVLLVAQKRMNKQGDMVIRNVKEEVNEVLEMTGFSDFLNIEE